MLQTHQEMSELVFSTFAEPAVYTPPGGAARNLRAVLNEEAETIGSGGYTEIRPMIRVLEKDLPKPQLGGVFVIDEASWVIDKPPATDYKIWKIIVRKLF